MRWFFALNEATPSFWEYANLMQVAVHSARMRTSLEPVCLYDGDDNVLTAWLQSAGVCIIRRQTFLQEWAPDLTPIPRGAYLRLEIPALCAELDWDDPFVLYTDCDVVFLRDPAPALAELAPRFLAVAPESDKSNLAQFNSGVMWMNVAGFAAENDALRQTIRENLVQAIAPPYDQWTLQHHFAGRADPLPLELNWKPYWGRNDEAQILHFHGPKPTQKHHTLNRRVARPLLRFAGRDYLAACDEWDRLLLEALAAHPWPDDADTHVADGFDSIAKVESGLFDPEPPRPEVEVPARCWGLAPVTTLTFTASPGDRLRFEAVVESLHPGQSISVHLNGKTLTQIQLSRLNDPYTISLDLPPMEGEQRVEVRYGKTFVPGGADMRPLGALFRALRVRRV